MAREWYLQSLAISEKQGDLHTAALTYHQLGRIAQEQRDFETARGWYLQSLAIKEKQGDLHGVAITYHELGILAGLQRSFEESGKWFTYSITGFQRTHDQHAMERNVRNFLVFYQQASPDEKEKLKAIWREAGLGPFPA
jgi:tetratricopeptide (TPR) repeat protein